MISNESKFINLLPYVEDDITWCVSRAKPRPFWISFFYFAKGAAFWIIGIIMFILAMICVFFLTTFESKPLDMWTVGILALGSLICFVTWAKPKKSLLRLLYGIVLIASYLCVTTFNAFFLNVLSYRTNMPQIRTSAEIYNHGFHLMADKCTLRQISDPKWVINISYIYY